jgi:hypothetical protein
MAKIKFPVQFERGLSKKYNLPLGILAIKFAKKYLKKIVEFYTTLTTWIDAHHREPDMDIEITVYYRDGTQKQEATAWALYGIMTNEMNGDQVGAESQMIKPMSLYKANLRAWVSIMAPDSIQTQKRNLFFVRQNYRCMDIRDARVKTCDSWIDIESIAGTNYLETIDHETIITLYGYRGMSQMDRRQLAKHIDGIFNQLSAMDIAVTSPEEIGHYWSEHQKWKQSKKIVDDSELITREEYREKHQACESCGGRHGQPVHLAHIQAVGMGGNRRDEGALIDPRNYLHLCNYCHIAVQHQKGWGAFLEKAPHLKYKVKTALKRAPGDPGKE